MPRRPRPEDEPVEGSPESWDETTPEALARVNAWISGGHPARCMERLERLKPRSNLRFQTTTIGLLAHCLDEHGATVRDLATTQEFHDLLELGPSLEEAIRRQEARLVDEIVKDAADLGSTRQGIWAISAVNRSISAAQFQRVWDIVCGTDLWKSSGPLCLEVVANAIGLGHAREIAIAFLEQNLAEIFDACGHSLVRYVIHAESLVERRGPWLSALLKVRPQAAAAVVHGSTGKVAPFDQLLKAVHMVVETTPNDEIAQLGVVLVAGEAPEFAIPHLVRWMHQPSGWFDSGGRLSWRLKKATNIHGPLMTALAEDSLSRPGYQHDLLAQIDTRMISDPQTVLNWIQANLEREAARDYMAALARLNLSKIDDGNPALPGLVTSAHVLHQRYGTRPAKRALQEYHLDGKDADPRLAAVALVRDVREPPRKPDLGRALANIRKLPGTDTVLGGKMLERALESNPFAFRYIRSYEEDLDAEEAQLEQRRAEGSMSDLWYAQRKRWIAQTRAFRQTWEDRFTLILGRGHKPDAKRILDDPFHWTELAVLARLLAAFPNVQREPRLPETEPKRLDFLISCPEGECFIEVAAVGTKPSEVLDAVLVSSGGDVKKTLQNKLAGQFKQGQVDLRRPCVIAVQTSWEHMLDFDGMNSLYGHFTFTWRPDDEGNMVEEGEVHNNDKAFFREKGVECISAVALIGPDAPTRPYFAGRLCRPLGQARYPLPPALWVKLRDALFGPDTSDLQAGLMRIPGMTAAEAASFVGLAIDDASFLAAGYHDYNPALGIPEARFIQLRTEAERRGKLTMTGRLEFLRVSEEQDLSSLHAAGIYTVARLMGTIRPAEVPEGLWASLEAEAVSLGYARQL